MKNKIDIDKLIRIGSIVSAASGLFLAIFGDDDKRLDERIDERLKLLAVESKEK